MNLPRTPQTSTGDLPNVAWSFWHEGTNKAPEVVKLCWESWRKNGDFDEVRILDSKTIFTFVSEENLPTHFSSMPVQMQSDAVRLALLSRYGGVWMDASTLLTRPIRQWLNEVSKSSGFFIFQNPIRGRGGRLFEVGFIAAAASHPFMVEWAKEHRAFFSRPRLHGAHSPTSDAPIWAKKVFALANRWTRKTPRRSALWGRFPLNRIPFYPYFITYYLGNRLLRDRRFQQLLGGIEHIDSSKYLELRGILNASDFKRAFSFLEKTTIPVHDIEFRTFETQQKVDAFREWVDGFISN